MNNLVFGKYIPIDSLMHRLDPRAKLIGLFLMIAAVFIPKSWWVFLVIALLLAVALLLAKIGIKMIVQSFKPMIMMMRIFSEKTRSIAPSTISCIAVAFFCD